MTRKFVSLSAFCLLIVAPAIDAEAEGAYFAQIVSDVDVSAEWYKATFGLVLETELSESGRYKIVNLHRPGVFIELLELDSVIERPKGRVKGPFKVGMLVSDLSDFVARLPDSMPEPKVILDSRNNLRLIQLSDPDGNIIQIMEMLDGETR
jgi:hypothetical protein